MIEAQRIAEARSLLARHFGPTRIARAESLSSAGHDVFLKIETGLPTGSFKVRGAIYALSKNVAARAVTEVVCASTGNHGAAVAYAAQLLGVRATIFLPAEPNPVKAARILALGARLVTTGTDLSAAIEAAQDYAERTPAFFLHDASDPDVPVGTATIGAEIISQLPEVDVIYVPMGDTALIRGVASAAKQYRASIRLVGVVAKHADAYLQSWAAARRLELGASCSDAVIETATCETIADGLAVRRPLAPNVAAIRELVDEVVAVSEEEMIAAIRHLHEREQVIAEPAGAAATAAFLKQQVRRSTQKPRNTQNNQVFSAGSAGSALYVVLLVTGCNIAPGVL